MVYDENFGVDFYIYLIEYIENIFNSYKVYHFVNNFIKNIFQSLYYMENSHYIYLCEKINVNSNSAP